jgi:hypothetical protein
LSCDLQPQQQFPQQQWWQQQRSSQMQVKEGFGASWLLYTPNWGILLKLIPQKEMKGI